ncbi:MAG: sugar nucleotide-binding protein, partial [Candidatus Dormiibacterota bacterium]
VLADHEAFGTYHATCQGECSWYEFAGEIFRLAGLQPDLSPQSSAEAGSAAPRPSYSVLDNGALRELGIDVLPAWRDGLERYLAVRAS